MEKKTLAGEAKRAKQKGTKRNEDMIGFKRRPHMERETKSKVEKEVQKER